MLSFLLSLLGVNPLGKLFDALTQAHRDELNAANDHDKVEATIRIKALDAEIAARQQATQIRLATAGFWEMRLFTAAIAFPFIVHITLVGIGTNFGALFGWEWALHIPAFPDPIPDWEAGILLSFFGLQGATTGIKAIAAGLAQRNSNG